MATIFLPKKRTYRALKPEELCMFKIFEKLDRHPLLWDCSHAVKNEGKRSKWEGGLQKQLGLRAGIPDIYIDYPCHGYHGLRIELKELSETTGRYGKPSPDQIKRIKRLNELGYKAVICYGFDDTMKTIDDYLKGLG